MLSIAGIDEAGRGALAGPVVAGACVLACDVFRRRRVFACWSPHRRIPAQDHLIADSKLLTPEERDAAYTWIIAHYPYGVGMEPHSTIEECGIVEATQRAMLAALEDLRKKTEPQQLLIDGRDAFAFPLPHTSIIRGDGSEPCIAAASIIAKVTRDRLMMEEHKHYPLYDFEQHKGYGTAFHRAAIRLHGPCALHRLSFLKNTLQSVREPLLPAQH